MTVTNDVRSVVYGPGTVFTVPFLVYEKEHLLVELRAPGGSWVPLALNQFNVTGLGNPQCTVTATVPAHNTVRISRVVPFTQTGINLGLTTGFNPELVEREFDLGVMRAQQTRDMLQRAATDYGVRGVTMMPGATAFGYGTTPIFASNDGGQTFTVPDNNLAEGVVTDFVVAIRKLKEQMPQVDRVLLVVVWFGNDLRPGHCIVRPQRERAGRLTSPRTWISGGVSYANAHTVKTINGLPHAGSSPDDESVRECIRYLRQEGYKVVFYPFLMMDIVPGNGLPDPYGGAEQAAIPWRGRMTVMPADQGTAAATTQVNAFFDNSYDAWIHHMCDICEQAGGVYGFCVGTEMEGLNRVRGAGNTFPAVTRFAQLVNYVKNRRVSQNVGYAANWSDYNNTVVGNNLFYNHDPLWAVSDFIGIDAYFPLSDWREGMNHADARRGWPSIHNLEYLKWNIEHNELVDWFYANDADRNTQTRTPITDGAYNTPQEFQRKNMRWFWSNQHFDRINGVRQTTPTAWIPKSKPIWFTEFGVPSVDKGTNQPNVFSTASGSAENFYPYFSTRTYDGMIQRAGNQAFVEYWKDHNEPGFISWENIYLWTWDARPHPAFPLRSDFWRDAGDWLLGHWLKVDETRTQPVLPYIYRLEDIAANGTVMSRLMVPAGGLVLGGEIEVLQTVTGASVINFGDSGNGDDTPANNTRYGSGIPTTAGTRRFRMVTPFPATNPVFARIGCAPAATSGLVRIRLLYIPPP